ncbi:hypothetical protein SteCoe_14435 [Stentor coeruleus]|uniref:Kelch motif family protein n=1 Tax=Stentor coeruleus TaxID=5963 RepID=A0A1R2C5Y3_9CILI|nr:hypothetical protein SteCoe_14435 [Stentor coeruleus]
MGTRASKIFDSSLQQNNIINGILQSPINLEEFSQIIKINSLNPKSNKNNHSDEEKILASPIEDLADFQDLHYFNRKTGQLFLITKESITEVDLKNKMIFPQESAVGYLSSKDIIAVGGVFNSELIESVFIISLILHEVKKVADLPKPCKQGQVHGYKNWVYYIGGICKGDYGLAQAPLMRYNVNQNLWQDLLRYGQDYKFNKIINMGTCILGNKLLLVGGQRLSSNKTLAGNKKIYSIDLEKGLKVQVEGKLPHKILRPTIASGSKQGIITGGVSLASNTLNRKSFRIEIQNDICHLTPIDDICIDLFELYPSYYCSKYAMFISFPNIAIRMKSLTYWLGYQITSNNSRLKLEFPKINPDKNQSLSLIQSELIENHQRKTVDKISQKRNIVEKSLMKKEEKKHTNHSEKKIYGPNRKELEGQENMIIDQNDEKVERELKIENCEEDKNEDTEKIKDYGGNENISKNLNSFSKENSDSNEKSMDEDKENDEKVKEKPDIAKIHEDYKEKNYEKDDQEKYFAEESPKVEEKDKGFEEENQDSSKFKVDGNEKSLKSSNSPNLRVKENENLESLNNTTKSPKLPKINTKAHARKGRKASPDEISQEYTINSPQIFRTDTLVPNRQLPYSLTEKHRKELKKSPLLIETSVDSHIKIAELIEKPKSPSNIISSFPKSPSNFEVIQGIKPIPKVFGESPYQQPPCKISHYKKKTKIKQKLSRLKSLPKLQTKFIDNIVFPKTYLSTDDLNKASLGDYNKESDELIISKRSAKAHCCFKIPTENLLLKPLIYKK